LNAVGVTVWLVLKHLANIHTIQESKLEVLVVLVLPQALKVEFVSEFGSELEAVSRVVFELSAPEEGKGQTEVDFFFALSIVQELKGVFQAEELFGWDEEQGQVFLLKFIVEAEETIIIELGKSCLQVADCLLVVVHLIAYMEIFVV